MPARAWLWLTVVLTGGAFTVAVARAPPASAAPGRGLAWVLFAGSPVHVASTGWRLPRAAGTHVTAPAGSRKRAAIADGCSSS